MAEETYAEITITGEEIERELEAEKNKVSEKDKIVYHNATVKRLESGFALQSRSNKNLCSFRDANISKLKIKNIGSWIY